MEVTRNSFHQVLPVIEAAIQECDFVSIDTEFTGIPFCSRLNCVTVCFNVVTVFSDTDSAKVQECRQLIVQWQASDTREGLVWHCGENGLRKFLLMIRLLKLFPSLEVEDSDDDKIVFSVINSSCKDVSFQSRLHTLIDSLQQNSKKMTCILTIIYPENCLLLAAGYNVSGYPFINDLSICGLVDIITVSGSSAVVSAASLNNSLEIIRRFKNNPVYKIVHYNPLWHSTLGRTSVWLISVSLTAVILTFSWKRIAAFRS